MMDEEKQLETDEGSGAENPEMAQPMENEAMPGESGNPGNQTLEFADIGIDPAPTSDGSAAAPSLEVQAELADMAGQVDALKAQLEERTSQYMRIAADFDNFRKRTQKEKEDLEQQVKCSTIVELLPVVDNFERARSQIKPQTDAEMNIHKSYQSVYKQLVECLKRIGVSPMRSEGKEFDPNLHEAVMREATDAHAEGTVIEELVRGYVLGDRVLRHAMVKVAAAPEPVVASDEDQGDAES